MRRHQQSRLPRSRHQRSRLQWQNLRFMPSAIARSARRTGILWIALAALLWSTGGIGIKAVDDPPLKVTFYRSIFAAVTLFLMFRREVRVRVTPAFLVAIVSYGACLTSFVIATKWTTAANAIFLQYAGVVWVLLFSPLFVGGPLQRRDVIAIAVAMLGMALFFVGKFEEIGRASCRERV